MMRISMPRGDMREQAFSVKLNQEPFVDAFDEIYFTVKKNFKDRNFLFQKRMTTGEIESVKDGMYQFVILPEDTNDLNFDDYVYIKRSDGSAVLDMMVKFVPFWVFVMYGDLEITFSCSPYGKYDICVVTLID